MAFSEPELDDLAGLSSSASSSSSPALARQGRSPTGGRSKKLLDDFFSMDVQQALISGVDREASGQIELRVQPCASSSRAAATSIWSAAAPDVELPWAASCLSRGGVNVGVNVVEFGARGMEKLRSRTGASFDYVYRKHSLLKEAVQTVICGAYDSLEAAAQGYEGEEEEEANLRQSSSSSSSRGSRKFGGVRLARQPPVRTLTVPLPLGMDMDLGLFAHVLHGWATAAIKSLASSEAALPAMQLVGGLTASYMLGGGGMGSALLPAAALPLRIAGFEPSGFLGAHGAASTHVGLVSLASAMAFIASLRGLSKHSTAQDGNLLGVLATGLGILSVMSSPGFGDAHVRFLATLALAGGAGYHIASRVKMEEMPQLVAGFHSFVGLAAVFAGFASYLSPESYSLMRALEMFAGVAVGSLTFTGSVVAAGKLHGVLPGSPVLMDNRMLINGLLAGATIPLGFAFCLPTLYAKALGGVALAANAACWGALGVNMVMGIGGADMPVIVSLLNAFSGIATSAAGFMLNNNLLTITGALVASSGTLLSDIMCRGINRSMVNVLMGGFGTDGGTGGSTPAASAATAEGRVQETAALGLVGYLLSAKKVVIVPGYGLAVARCQSKIAEIVELLRRHSITVHFAIHPVAGRLPGHMNVLLAEASVPYDIVREMEDINEELPTYDVAIVLGANDIVNPATQTDVDSPIFGMPAIEVWKCKTCVVMKRSMGTGYSGVDNPLFYRDNVRMLFGDAKASCDAIYHHLEDSSLMLQTESTPHEEEEAERRRAEQRARELAEEQSYPMCTKVVGILKERSEGEKRVSITPSVLPRLRKMGFSVLLEAGAGVLAGFSDEDYIRKGGSQAVRVAESASEVLTQADVVLKVTQPLLDEVHMLKGSQTMIGFWNMFEHPHLLDALKQSSATFANLSLVPRVSRAQKLDALTSMANIAGYRAVLDAFNRLPRFSRSSVTACGAVPPAKVFIIGVGVAGLSAIATACALGAKVLANDVREAAREQVESMGAEFVPLELQGIAGEGAGGYAREMGSTFLAAQKATYAKVIKDCDVVITTAMIPNKAAPTLITAEMLETMKSGSVVIDLAAQTGGNCELTVRDGVATSPSGVVVVGETNYPSQMAAQASDLLGNNFVAMLDTLGGAADFGGDHWKDPIIEPATVLQDGVVKWPPPPPPPQAAPAAPPPAAGAAAGQRGGPASAQPEGRVESTPQPPQSLDAILRFIEDNKPALAFAVGSAVLLGLGVGANIPESEMTQIGYFVLSLLVGHFTVSGVTPALHTPLISVTNAISGIIVVGGMLQLSGPLLSARVGCALAAVFLSSINIVGGFAVTQRMLEMFKEDRRRG
eukprot:TRINITY_DN48123_c0_g1_i1.p1 TRINITY_DN48123_c0_g1~~TRINITY_DN48123_c0_g1_i1.p1  ORF type:complete len:1343 (-),score=328.86 TRINITY_DN48123_c0_g1_i1:273-4301(-)